MSFAHVFIEFIDSRMEDRNRVFEIIEEHQDSGPSVVGGAIRAEWLPLVAPYDRALAEVMEEDLGFKRIGSYYLNEYKRETGEEGASHDG